MLTAKQALNLTGRGDGPEMSAEQYVTTILAPEIEAAARKGFIHYNTRGPNDIFAKQLYVDRRSFTHPWILEVMNLLVGAGYRVVHMEIEERNTVSRYLNVRWDV